MSEQLKNRVEFVMLYEVENGNPNGDPDAGNMPRIDPETSHGIVTDVCLKRKVRNYVEMVKGGTSPYRIYVTEGAVLNDKNQEAHDSLGKSSGEKDKSGKKEKLGKEDISELRSYMCENYYDIRTFGAVMAMSVNCGQVRGPVQFGFSRSIDPIVQQDITITRMAVTKKEDESKERTMGRKHIVPYALYRVEGYVSVPLAKQTNFNKADLDLLLESLVNLFEHDRSAARGKMATRKLFVFEHDTEFGSVPAHKLFDKITVNKVNLDAPARKFADYDVVVDRENIPSSVKLIELI